MPAGTCQGCGGYASDGVLCHRCKTGKAWVVRWATRLLP